MKNFLMLVLITILFTGLSFAGSITVNSPNGGEVWLRGSAHNITWNSTNLTNQVKITLWKNNVFVGLIIKDQPANGILNWTVGNYQGGIAAYGTDYKIKIREQGGTAFTTEDMSNGNFKIKSKFTLGVKPEIMKKKPVFKPGPGMFAPKIESALTVPLGALMSGSRLFLTGKNFGKNEGEILMYGDFPTNPVKLVKIEWKSNTKINGYIPKYQYIEGAKNQDVNIIVLTEYKTKSTPWKMKYAEKLYIFEPHAGESLKLGNIKQIKWDTVNVSDRTVIITIMGNSGGYVIATKVPVSQNSFNWKVGLSASGSMMDNKIGSPFWIKIQEDDGGEPIVFGNGANSRKFSLYK